jgi:hypothetical protein
MPRARSPFRWRCCTSHVAVESPAPYVAIPRAIHVAGSGIGFVYRPVWTAWPARPGRRKPARDLHTLFRACSSSVITVPRSCSIREGAVPRSLSPSVRRPIQTRRHARNGRAPAAPRLVPSLPLRRSSGSREISWWPAPLPMHEPVTDWSPLAAPGREEGSVARGALPCLAGQGGQTRAPAISRDDPWLQAPRLLAVHTAASGRSEQTCVDGRSLPVALNTTRPSSSPRSLLQSRSSGTTTDRSNSGSQCRFKPAGSRSRGRPPVAAWATKEEAALSAAAFRFSRSLAAMLLARGPARARVPRKPRLWGSG